MNGKVNRSKLLLGLSVRRAALYKCSSTNLTKDKVLVIFRIQTQPTSCHRLQPDFYRRVILPAYS